MIRLFGHEVFAIGFEDDLVEFEDDEEPFQWNGAAQVSAQISSPDVVYDPDDRYRWDEDHRRKAGFGFAP